MKNLFFFLFMISFFAAAQSRFEDIELITGKWKLENDENNLFEEWEKINDTTFYGKSYLLNNGKVSILEKLNILKLNDHIVYIAQPKNNNPTLFTLVKSEGNQFIFENEEHDFPQVIIYHFISENTLNASIEGIVEGSLKRKEFFFRKTE